ncbi:MAG: hypothetical protein A3F17_07115 [Gammaproteobacteria bacterium RIFCSPHIGHO2_12_FULL_41_15]|nr:MAG: hypothetical protein A3F17_07115 [Gammaproteobacteria bacterium RIFCSPHIGHO2_12_FULL_41_15]
MSSAASQIKKYIDSLPEGETFPSSALRSFATTENIRQILNRLVKRGEVKRVTRGIFVKPKHSRIAGEILPSAIDIAAALTQSTGETIVIQGAEAARILQLTTQVPLKLIFYTSGNTRILKFNNTNVKLNHVNPSRLIAAGTTPGLVISALTYLGRENVTEKTIEKIKQHISLQEFNDTIKLIAKMPSWMADVFYCYQKRENT